MRRRTKTCVLIRTANGGWRVVAAVVALWAAGPAHAAITTWTGPDTGGVFNDDANWSLDSPGDNVPPPPSNGLQDQAIFGGAGNVNVNGTITFDASVTHLRTTVQNTSGTVSFDTGTHKWTMNSYMLITAQSAPGFPKIRHVGGEIQSQMVLFGTDSTSPNPSLELTGNTTRWHTLYESGGFGIGYGPEVNGATMLVHNGAKMTSLGPVLIGLQGSRDSKLTVDGVGAQMLLGGSLAVGYTGMDFGNTARDNSAEFINGATATATHVLMGITDRTENNTLLVSGAGSKLTLFGFNNNDGTSTDVGRAGINNVLRIESGGVVDGVNRFIVGREETSTGNQILINNGSLSGTEIEIRRGNVTVTDGTIDLIQFLDESVEPPVYDGGGIVAEMPTATFTFNSGTVRQRQREHQQRLGVHRRQRRRDAGHLPHAEGPGRQPRYALLSPTACRWPPTASSRATATSRATSAGRRRQGAGGRIAGPGECDRGLEQHGDRNLRWNSTTCPPRWCRACSSTSSTSRACSRTAAR